MSKKAPGMVGMYFDLPIELAKKLREFCDVHSVSYTDQIRLAIKRHLAYPPAIDAIPALPDSQPKKRRRK